jgi:p-methyltransferase
VSAAPIEALFIPFYADIDRWHNDPSPLDEGAPPPLVPAVGLSARRARMRPWALWLDGGAYDLTRFLSWVGTGSTLTHERFDAFRISPLAPHHHASFLTSRGHEVRVAPVVNRRTLARLAAAYQPRFVLLSTSFFVELDVLGPAVAHLRQSFPEAAIVLGGQLLLELSKILTEPAFRLVLRRLGADAYVVSARGESALAAILECGSRAGLLAAPDLPATYVLTGGVARPPARPVDDEIPLADGWVRWRGQRDALYHTVNVRSSRSCAYECAFCSFPVNQGPHAVMPLESFARELDELAACQGVRTLVFTDDTLNVPLPRFKALCRLLQRYDFQWYGLFRPQSADQEAVQLMKASGCAGVFLGLESADDRVLANMTKHTSVAQLRRGVELLREHGIWTHGNFIVGFPGETEASAWKIPALADELELDTFCASLFILVPSTPIQARRAEFDLEGQYADWRHATMTSQQATELASAVAGGARRAIHLSDLTTQLFWGTILLQTSGVTREETRVIFRAFDRLRGQEIGGATLRAAADVAQVRVILERRGLAPAGA